MSYLVGDGVCLRYGGVGGGWIRVGVGGVMRWWVGGDRVSRVRMGGVVG